MINRIITDMPAEVYHAHPAISKSGLDKFALSPRHYHYAYLSDEKELEVESDALRFGKAFHTMLLEPEKFDDQVAIAPAGNRSTKAWKEAYADFMIEHGHKTIIRPEEYADAKNIAKGIKDHAAARYLLKGTGRIEPSLFWQDEETGVHCRARFDWLRDDGLIVDLKTSRCAKPEAFERHAYEYRYHVQAAIYTEAYRRVFGEEPQGFAFIAVEKNAPYCACTFMASDEFIELGMLEYRHQLRRFAECQQKNSWPGYPDAEVVPLELPYYAQKLLLNGEYNNV